MEWIKAARWEGPSVASKKWLVSGHSNGGVSITCNLLHLKLNDGRPRNLVCSDSPPR